MNRIGGFQTGHHLDVGAYELVIHIELDVFPLVVDTEERIEPAPLEHCGDLLPDDVFEVLIFTGNLDVDIEIAMVNALDFGPDGQIRRLGPSGAETRHAVDHEFTS